MGFQQVDSFEMGYAKKFIWFLDYIHAYYMVFE